MHRGVDLKRAEGRDTSRQVELKMEVCSCDEDADRMMKIMMCLSVSSGQTEGQASLEPHHPAESELIKNNECFCRHWSTPHCDHFTFLLHHSVNLSTSTFHFVFWTKLYICSCSILSVNMCSAELFKLFNAVSQKKEKFHPPQIFDSLPLQGENIMCRLDSWMDYGVVQCGDRVPREVGALETQNNWKDDEALNEIKEDTMSCVKSAKWLKVSSRGLLLCSHRYREHTKVTDDVTTWHHVTCDVRD